jgi:Holliday junction resolvase
MKEQAYQSKILKYLNDEGYYAVKVISASKKGVPDIIACINGKFVGIEVKTPRTRNNTSELQKYNIELIKESKGIAGVAVTIDDVKELIKELV